MRFDVGNPVALERPDAIEEVVAYGQISKNLFFNEEIFAILDGMRLNTSERDQLAQIKEKDAYTVDDLEFVSAKAMMGGHYFTKGLFRMSFFELLVGMLTSPDYTFDDLAVIGDNGYRNDTSLMLELVDIDLTPTFEEIEVPYHMYQGSRDIITSTDQLTEIVNQVDNNNITLDIILDNAHFPSIATIDQLIAVFN